LAQLIHLYPKRNIRKHDNIADYLAINKTLKVKSGRAIDEKQIILPSVCVIADSTSQ
jgi:hypothetical protein